MTTKSDDDLRVRCQLFFGDGAGAGAVVAGAFAPGPTAAVAGFAGAGAGIGRGLSDWVRKKAMRLIRCCVLDSPAKVILVPGTMDDGDFR